MRLRGTRAAQVCRPYGPHPPRFARHLPLKGKAEGDRKGRPYGGMRTGSVCSVKPGAEQKPHRLKFWGSQGPVAREETQIATQILRAGNFTQPCRYASPVMGDRGPTPLVKGRWPKARGDREGEYGHGVSILSRPPAILWFLSHRWERNSPPAGGEISPPKQQISAGAAKSPARTSRSGASGRPRPTEEAKISGGGGGKPPPYSILLTMPAPQTVPSSAPFRGTWPYPLYLPLDKGSRPSRGRL